MFSKSFLVVISIIFNVVEFILISVLGIGIGLGNGIFSSFLGVIGIIYILPSILIVLLFKKISKITWQQGIVIVYVPMILIWVLLYLYSVILKIQK